MPRPLPTLLLVFACATASAPVEVIRAARIESNVAAAETDAVLAAAERVLRDHAQRGVRFPRRTILP